MLIPYGFLASSAPVIYSIDYLLVAGGAAGGGLFGTESIPTQGMNGDNSTFNGLTAIGGGGGGFITQDTGNASNGSPGGSGGGGAYSTTGGMAGQGGLGTVGQGFNGGMGFNNVIAGGGGGASEDAISNGHGGDGVEWIDGNIYGGGGGGGNDGSGSIPLNGGTGGGGSGALNTVTGDFGQDATGNGSGGGGAPGSGGGGAGGLLASDAMFTSGISYPIVIGLGGAPVPDPTNFTGGRGSDGICIVSYINATQRGTGGTVTSTGSGDTTRWYHTFTTDGAYVA